MAKMAKDTQTDYTKGGKQISDTSIPLYTKNLTRMDEYLENPSRSIDTYLDKYFNADTASYNDFLRNYTRQMANVTANNYAATGGGYTTSGQRAFEDQQRAQDKLAARLREQGINTAYMMSASDYNNMLNANSAYYNAYGLGKDYSNIERYNNMADQNNSFGNQIGGALPAIGTAVGSLFGPVGAMVGGAIGGMAGNAMTTDTSSLQNVLGAGGANQAQYNAAQGNMYTNNPRTGQSMYNLNNAAGLFGYLSNVK